MNATRWRTVNDLRVAVSTEIEETGTKTPRRRRRRSARALLVPPERDGSSCHASRRYRRRCLQVGLWTELRTDLTVPGRISPHLMGRRTPLRERIGSRSAALQNRRLQVRALSPCWLKHARAGPLSDPPRRLDLLAVAAPGRTLTASAGQAGSARSRTRSGLCDPGHLRTP